MHTNSYADFFFFCEQPTVSCLQMSDMRYYIGNMTKNNLQTYHAGYVPHFLGAVFDVEPRVNHFLQTQTLTSLAGTVSPKAT
jgi:hypothetical protein